MMFVLFQFLLHSFLLKSSTRFLPFVAPIANCSMVKQMDHRWSIAIMCSDRYKLPLLPPAPLGFQLCLLDYVHLCSTATYLLEVYSRLKLKWVDTKALWKLCLSDVSPVETDKENYVSNIHKHHRSYLGLSTRQTLRHNLASFKFNPWQLCIERWFLVMI
jgi:hypothetical protein